MTIIFIPLIFLYIYIYIYVIYIYIYILTKSFIAPFYGWGSIASIEPWGHSVVLNMGHLDWESSALTSRTLKSKKKVPRWLQNVF